MAITYRLNPYDYGKLDLELSPGYYDSDYLMECALVAVCKHYLEKELGHEKNNRQKSLESDGYELKYHRGYCIHHVGDEKKIDLCLTCIELHKDSRIRVYKRGKSGLILSDDYKKMIKKYNLGNLNVHQTEEALRELFSDALTELVKHRGSMWT